MAWQILKKKKKDDKEDKEKERTESVGMKSPGLYDTVKHRTCTR